MVLPLTTAHRTAGPKCRRKLLGIADEPRADSNLPALVLEPHFTVTAMRNF